MASNRTSQTGSRIETIVLIVEALHLNRGKNVSLLAKIKNGEANKRGIRYIVVNLDLKTEEGGEQMRAEVAKQTRALIQEHKPNQVFLAVDYNEGETGGDCTLANLIEHLLNTSDDLAIMPIIIDTKAFREGMSAQQESKLNHQFKAKEIVLLELIIYGGNLEKLKAACDLFAKGDNSHWLRWQAKIRATIQIKATTPLLKPKSNFIKRADSAPPIPSSIDFSTSTVLQTILEETNQSSTLNNHYEPKNATMTRRPSFMVRAMTMPNIASESKPREDAPSPYFFGQPPSPDEIKEAESPRLSFMGLSLNHAATTKINYPAYYPSKQFDSSFAPCPSDNSTEEITNSTRPD
jgi:hypothetical protein